LDLQQQCFQLCIGNLLLETTALGEEDQLLLHCPGKLRPGEPDGVEPFTCFRFKDLQEQVVNLGLGLLLPLKILLHHLLVH
jgi:hypothetical protein